VKWERNTEFATTMNMGQREYTAKNCSSQKKQKQNKELGSVIV
jgi:hypothetical protein